MSKWNLAAAIVAGSLVLTGCGGSGSSSSNSNAASTPTISSTDEAAFKTNVANIAHAMYADSLTTAKALDTAVDAFLANPTEESLTAAKQAYEHAREPYQQSEIMRFDTDYVTAGFESDRGIVNVDDWEGQVNAWPLDEAIIDYVNYDVYRGSFEAGYQGAEENSEPKENIINSTVTFDGSIGTGNDAKDVSLITTDLIVSMQEFAGGEANVTTGVHAIEFLLWGQDINSTDKVAGQRAISDFYTEDSHGVCTSGGVENAERTICQRRADYLSVAVDLLVSDLTQMEAEWNIETEGKTLRNEFMTNADSVKRMLGAMVELAGVELASERMQKALDQGDPENEHDCFSDLTNWALYNNAKGIQNIYFGTYSGLTNIEGGKSLSDLVKANNASVDTEMRAKLETVEATMSALLASDYSFDQLIALGDDREDSSLIAAGKDALIDVSDYGSDHVKAALGI